MRAALFRFLVTPGEAWIRMAALLCGATVNTTGSGGICVESEQTVRFTVGMYPDRTRIRIGIGREWVDLEKAAAEKIAHGIADAVSDMRAPGDPA